MGTRAIAPVTVAARRAEPPAAVRLLLMAIALAAMALTVGAVVARIVVQERDPGFAGLSAGTAAEPQCGPIEEAPESGIIACAHADERPEGIAEGEPSLEELTARAGGSTAIGAFADAPVDLAADPAAVDITDGTKVHGNKATRSDTASLDDGALRADGSMSVFSTVPTGGTPGIPCIGDGKTGNRVQALYVYPSNRPDRGATVIPMIRRWAADVDRVVRLSAAQKTSKRHVKWVHSAGCVLTVTKVKLTSYATGSFSRTISELAAKGYKRADRRYLIWFDANTYCGIGRFYPDDRYSTRNKNNGAPYGPTSYARTDTQCWGLLASGGVSVEAHELMHTVGAVQSSAPRSTRAGHCFDEYDTMCYADGGRGPMKYVCSKPQEAYLDCGKNDYFNPKPTSGSYLATHWNTARSSFFSSTAVGDPLIETATRGSPTGLLTAPTVTVALNWKAVLDSTQVRTRIEVAKDGGAYAALKTVTGTGRSTSVSLARGHTYLLRLRAEDSAGRWSAWWVLPALSVDPQDAPPTVTAPTISLSYRDGTAVWLDVSWTATDDVSWSPVSELQEEVNLSGVWTTVGTFDYPGTSLARSANVTYRYRVRAKDDVGQWSAYATSAQFKVVDTPPTVSGVTVTPQSFGAAEVYFNVSWNEGDDDGVASAELGVLIGSSATWASVPDFYNGDSYVGTVNTSYKFRVRVRDTAGQWSSWAAAPGSYSVVDAAPQVSNVAVQLIGSSGGVATFQASWDATDDGYVETAQVRWTTNGGASATVISDAYPGIWFDVPSGPAYQFSVRAKDGVGQWSGWSAWTAAVSST